MKFYLAANTRVTHVRLLHVKRRHIFILEITISIAKSPNLPVKYKCLYMYMYIHIVAGLYYSSLPSEAHVVAHLSFTWLCFSLTHYGIKVYKYRQ